MADGTHRIVSGPGIIEPVDIELEALIVRDHARWPAELAHQLTPVVPLRQGVALVPLVPTLHWTLTGTQRDLMMGSESLTAGVAQAASVASQYGRVVYLRLDYRASAGSECAVGWHLGEISFGPQLSATDSSECPTGAYVVGPPRAAVNQALRWFGVSRGPHPDEFDAVGLGWHSTTADWDRPDRGAPAVQESAKRETPPAVVSLPWWARCIIPAGYLGFFSLLFAMGEPVDGTAEGPVLPSSDLDYPDWIGPLVLVWLLASLFAMILALTRRRSAPYVATASMIVLLPASLFEGLNRGLVGLYLHITVTIVFAWTSYLSRLAYRESAPPSS